MSRTIIDLHVLQTVPPSNLNRDENGTPKTAMYGGVRRARVSSQAWKRATRQYFADVLDASYLGTRTKRLVELVSDQIVAVNPELQDSAAERATAVLKAAGITIEVPKAKKPKKGDQPADEPDALPEAKYLVFLSALQISALAQLAADIGDSALDSKEAKASARALVKGKNSIDLALFGRMVADVADLNVDASAQVAHAISVHAVNTEFDFYTAVDDHKAKDAEEDAGAGMMGTVEFNSSTLYRFATVDVDRLRDNLGDAEATVRAVVAFVESFVRSMPTGKQNTFANRTVPDVVLVTVREDQPMSLAGAFEEAVVPAASGGYVVQGARALAGYANDLYRAYDAVPRRAWVTAVGSLGHELGDLGEPLSLSELLAEVSAVASERFPAS